MAGTNAWMNSQSWTYTPTTGSPISLSKVKGWSLNRGISRAKEAGDYDRFFSLNVCDFEDPRITLDTLNTFAGMLIDATLFGTLTGIVRDAYNGAITGGGGRQLTMINCGIEDDGGGGQHRQYARASLTFSAWSPDGQTNPLSISAL
jgi:hypothetical protein